MLSNHFKSRDFHIVDLSGKDIDGCCQFLYNGYQISASTLGRSLGGCMNPVMIFAIDKATGNYDITIGNGFLTISDAIDYINNLIKG